MFDWFNTRFIDAPTTSESNKSGHIGNSPLANSDQIEECVAYKNNGDAYLDRGDFAQAAAHYRKAISCNPHYAEAYNNLGNTCSEQNLLDDAERFLKQAITLKPDLANAYYNLATLQLEQDRLNEAIENYIEVLKHEPGHFAALGLLLFQLQKTCNWEQLDSNVRVLRAATASPVESAIGIFSPFTFMSIPGATAEEQKRCAEKWIHSEFEVLIGLRKKLGFEFSRPAKDKISVAYISADFQQHPVAFLMAEVFELHDRSRFHITAYSCGKDDNSPMRRRLAAAFDNFVDIRNLSDEQAARRIYADQVDILVDLTGHTRDSRCGILALRPAPVQVNYLGYPGTMGADFIDYIIADRFTIPPEMTHHYTEEVVWMPDCFQANDRTRPRLAAPTRASCGLPDHAFVFCCFNQTYKISPEVFDLWCRLLSAVPDSILWIPACNPFAETNLRREVAARGIATERLIMAPLLGRDEHLARMQCADLFLDTLPYNAGTTCSDALWMGLPVVTCAGEAFVSRMGGSLLTAIGAPELITYNLEDYYRLALELSTDRNRLAAIRSKIIANRDAYPLFDSVRFTRNLEQAYLNMMDNFALQNSPKC